MNKKHPQGIFALMLCLFFAIFTLALTAAAASVYRNISAGMEKNHAVRTALSYVSTKVRQAEEISAQNGCLLLYEEDCISRIYFQNGAIMEHFGQADAEFEPDFGDEIIKAENLAVGIKNSAIEVEITIDGAVYPLIFAEKQVNYEE